MHNDVIMTLFCTVFIVFLNENRKIFNLNRINMPNTTFLGFLGVIKQNLELILKFEVIMMLLIIIAQFLPIFIIFGQFVIIFL